MIDRNSGTILIVDDQERNIQVVGTTLSAFGFDFMTASSGEQALERVQARTPDLVLLDVMMPVMNGFDTCQKMRTLPGMENVPVIFLSADDEKNTIVRALECGGVDYVTKPFNKAELLARVRSHLELKKTRDRLVELNNSREQFIEVMAHDLKNWIGSAKMNAMLLEERAATIPEPLNRAPGSMVESLGMALAFIDDFLDSARSARFSLELRPRSVDLVELTRECLLRQNPAAGAKSIDFEVRLPEHPVTANTDPAAVVRILDNLISNAVKFSPRGSTVTLTLADQPVRITIEDQGAGFSDEDLKKVFEPYTRLSARPTGGEISTGLGLSVVKHLADALAVGVSVGNREQTGARISLAFPL